MQEFLLTLVVLFVLFKIFGKSASSSKSNFNFTQNNYTASEKKPDGKVIVDYIPENKSAKSTDSGDYVDYEEVK